MGAAPKGDGGEPPPGESGANEDNEAFHWFMEAWMGRVEAKLDGLAETLGRQRRVSLDGEAVDDCEGKSAVLSLQQTFERQISNPFQRQQTPGGNRSALAEPLAPPLPGVGENEAALAVTPESGLQEPRPSRDSSWDDDLSDIPAREGPATRSPSRQSREQDLAKRMELEMGSVKLSAWGRLVLSQRFDSMVTVAIVLNAVVLGVEVQLLAISNTSFEWFDHVEFLFTFVFTVELFLRLSVHRLKFFTDSRERLWNIYDCLLIAASWVDFLINNVMPNSSAYFFKTGRVIRMFRIIRVVRTVRFLSQLRVMLIMIMGTLQSLFWVMLILVSLLYCVSIILTQGATDYLNPPDGQVPIDHELVGFMFGSLFQTMYTLFQCMSGGVNWGQASYLMRGPGWAMEALVVVYVFFTIFAVVNIVNGVFVDGAIQLAQQDRMLFVEKKRLDDRAKEAQLLHLLNAMDENNDNIITLEEFCDSLEKQDIIDYFSALHIDIEDAKQFFPLLDLDGCGQVDLFQFVTGMEKLRGEARSADIHIVLHQNKKVMTMLNSLMKLLGGQGDAAY